MPGTTNAPAINPGTSPDKDVDNHLEEWKQARDVLQFFDDKSHDLRKYGFSFVTVLLTAEGILIPTKDVNASAPIKFAIFFVTLLLILALNLIDKNYRVYQKAAAMRALVLEKMLNLELSETITERYQSEHINRNVWWLYFFFILSVFGLGSYSLYPDLIYIAILGAIAIVAIVFTYRLGLSYKYKEYSEDWTISPLECTTAGKVKITLTNLKAPMDDKQTKEQFKGKYIKGMRISEPIVFKKDDPVCEIISEDSGKIYIKKAGRDIIIYDSQTWILKGSEFGKSGVYQLRPRGWPLPLHRRIIVSDNTGEPIKKKLGTVGD